MPEFIKTDHLVYFVVYRVYSLQHDHTVVNSLFKNTTRDCLVYIEVYSKQDCLVNTVVHKVYKNTTRLSSEHCSSQGV